jgi:hypothetical protein
LVGQLGQRLFVIGEDAALVNLMKLAANVLTATALECMGEEHSPSCTFSEAFQTKRGACFVPIGGMNAKTLAGAMKRHAAAETDTVLDPASDPLKLDT